MSVIEIASFAGFRGTLVTESWTAQRIREAHLNRQQYTLFQPLVFSSAALGVTITVPAGFVTDLASIPRIAWRYIAPTDPCIEYPSVVHDWLYRSGGLLDDGRRCTREQADAVLIEAMATCGARWDQRKVVCLAVRVGGGSSWMEVV